MPMYPDDPGAAPSASRADTAIAPDAFPRSATERPAGREGIVGDSDERVPVTDAFLKKRPYCSICRIESVDAKNPGAVRTGSGWHVGSGVVVTAAHVAQDPDEGERLMTVSLAPHGAIPAMIRIGGISSVHHTFIPPQWRARTDATSYAQLLPVHDYDYAILSTGLHRHIDGKFGPLVVAEVTDASTLGWTEISTAGYGHDTGTVMLRTRSRVRPGSFTGRHALHLFDHEVDTKDGASGSPLYRASAAGDLEAIGIHTQRIDGTRNRAVAIHPELATAVRDAIAAANGGTP